MQPPETLLPAAPEPEDARSREELIAENNPLRLEVAYIKKSTALARARASAAPQKKHKECLSSGRSFLWMIYCNMPGCRAAPVKSS